MPSWEIRQERLRASAGSRWLSEWARRALLLEYEDEGLPSPVLNARRMADLAGGIEGVVNLSAGGQIHRQPPDFGSDRPPERLRRANHLHRRRPRPDATRRR